MPRYTFKDSRSRIIVFEEDGSHPEFTFIDAGGKSTLVPAYDASTDTSRVPDPTGQEGKYLRVNASTGVTEWGDFPAAPDEVPDGGTDGYLLMKDSGSPTGTVWVLFDWNSISNKPFGLDGVGTVYDLGSQPISQFSAISGGTPYTNGFLVRASAPGYEYTNIKAWYRFMGGNPDDANSYSVISNDAVEWEQPSNVPFTTHSVSRPFLTRIPDAVKAMPKNDARTYVPNVIYQVIGDMSAYRDVVLRFSVKGQINFNPEETIAYVEINLNAIPLPFNFTGADLVYALNDAVSRRTFENYPPYNTQVERFVKAALDFPLFEWNEASQRIRYWAPTNVIEDQQITNVVGDVEISVISGPDIITDCWALIGNSSEERRFPLGADAILSAPQLDSLDARRTVLTHLRDIERDVTALGENATTLVIVDSMTGFIQIPGADAIAARFTNLLSIGFSDGDTIDFYSNIGFFDDTQPPDVSFIVNPGSVVGDLLDFYFPGVTLDLVPSPISGYLLRMTQLAAAAANGVEMMLVWNQSIFGAGLPQFGFPGYGSEQPLRGEIIQASTDDEHVASEVEVPLPYIPVGAPVDKGNVKSKLLRILAALTDGATARLATIIKGPYTATQQIQSGGLRFGSQFLVSDLGVSDGDVFTITTVTAGDFTLTVTPTVTLDEFVWFVNNTLGQFGIEQKAHVRLSPRLQRLIAAWQVGGDGDFPVVSTFGDGVAKIFA